MKEKGFTLVELLAVVTILALLVLIVSVSITKTLKDNKKELSNTQINLIKSAAEAWGAANLSKVPVVNDCISLELKDLKELGLLEEKIIDPDTNKEIEDTLKIKISSIEGENGSVKLEYEVNPKDTNYCLMLSEIDETCKVDYEPTVPNAPELMGALKPIKYDEDKKSWVIADKDKVWYDYEKQKWANAVILKNGVTKEVGDTIKIPNEVTDSIDDIDVQAMFVWIPRYEYKIDGDYGKCGVNEIHPGAIDVKFIEKSKTTADEGYIMHPAFTFGGVELSGIWVGKFEASATTDSTIEEEGKYRLTVLPNQQSMLGYDVNTRFDAAKKFTTTYLNDKVDSHMMKNSEWGAVAYLSQSIYGKYGNSDYAGVNKEVFMNNSGEDESYIATGRSSGKIREGSYTQEGTCKYDEEGTFRARGTGLCGPGASTTGNIYGVYDMNGGGYDMVMGNYNGTLGSSGFTVMPDQKYYDKYTTEDLNTACDGGICYGHALSETKNWYGSSKEFIDSENPWILRGGFSLDLSALFFSTDPNASIFAFESFNGDGTNASYRITLSSTS